MALREESKVNSEGGQRMARCREELAAELVAALGIDGARRMCRENCWDGVGSAIEKLATERQAA